MPIKAEHGPFHSTDFNWLRLLTPAGPSQSGVVYIERWSAEASRARALTTAQWARVSKKAEFNPKKYFYEMSAIMAQNMAEMYKVFESTSFVSLMTTLSVI